jgi:hypothetical protein
MGTSTDIDKSPYIILGELGSRGLRLKAISYQCPIISLNPNMSYWLPVTDH